MDATGVIFLLQPRRRKEVPEAGDWGLLPSAYTSAHLQEH